MFQASVLASGSKGNSILVRTESTKILLDAGLSGKKITNFIHSIELDENKIDAVVISHEHSDHIRGAGIICRKLQIPLYISESTYNACNLRLGKLPVGPIYFENGSSTFVIGDIEIRAFQSSHDVVDGSNFTLRKIGDDSRKLAVATDLGFSSNLMITQLKNSTSIILESNHDLNMLIKGSYPPHLKQRIKSKQGHLSNEQAVKVIKEVYHPGLKNIILAHLSEENNLPEIAEKLMRDYLNKKDKNLNLIVASQYESTKIIDV
ncbi:MAG: MBL fold metallo-hydrolase [Candidatus Tenebribacter burtonii]|jgi:phosphoribosyl 1,2-cyclic phosphodiesterase|nr:MBL fold metallo-hydrolase [Candidatus Tenebribacter burtonii]